jgi:SAM-dependent methyltransferase/spore coat polysaccharide biosynthesis predicted glycosyltransferase SpsG
LVVPALEAGRGGGHLARSAALVRELREKGRDARLYLPDQWEDAEKPFLKGLLEICPPGGLIRGRAALDSQAWDLIVLDRYQTPRKELEVFASLAPVLGIDEGGPGRDSFDFLLDLLPGLPGRGLPNMASVSLNRLPENRRPSGTGTHPAPRVLISFGTEDPAGLTLPVLRALLPPGQKGFPPVECTGPAWTVVYGTLEDKPGGRKALRELAGFPGLSLVREIPNLREHLAEYDLVITHFGLTAFESLHAGAAVLLVSPGRYHQRLARGAGFLSAGAGKSGARRTRKILCRGGVFNPAALEELGHRSAELARRWDIQDPPETTLGACIDGMVPLVPVRCPACGAENRLRHPVAARFPERTYRRCPDCKTLYMIRSSPPPIEYAGDYFFDFYKQQYGKTYLEDFAHLKTLGKGRIRRIRRLLHGREGREERLLDIGCAYGPFLSAAAEAGFSPAGIDPAEDAVRFVKEKLKIPAFRGFFPDPIRQITLRDRSFLVITLWYVIEHFEDLRRVLREINRLLKPGGILAFATPSFAGISARKSGKLFLEKSPPDHWTILDPRHIRPLLGRYGFQVKDLAVTGHHPERFPGFLGRAAAKSALANRLLSGLSRLGGLGDTFEVYAVKEEEVPGEKS